MYHFRHCKSSSWLSFRLILSHGNARLHLKTFFPSVINLNRVYLDPHPSRKYFSINSVKQSMPLNKKFHNFWKKEIELFFTLIFIPIQLSEGHSFMAMPLTILSFKQKPSFFADFWTKIVNTFKSPCLSSDKNIWSLKTKDKTLAKKGVQELSWAKWVWSLILILLSLLYFQFRKKLFPKSMKNMNQST